MPWQKGRPRGPQSEEHAEKRRLARWGERRVIPLDVQAWTALLWRAWKVAFRDKGPKNVGKVDMLALATIIAEHGRPDDPIAQEIRTGLVTLLFDRRRLDWSKGQSLRRHIALIPSTLEGQMLLARAVNVVNAKLPMAYQPFSVEVFAAAVATLGSVAAVERHLHICLNQKKRVFKTVGAIFQPNSIEFVANSRGTESRVGSGQAGGYNSPDQNAEYYAQLSNLKAILSAVRKSLHIGQVGQSHHGMREPVVSAVCRAIMAISILDT